MILDVTDICLEKFTIFIGLPVSDHLVALKHELLSAIPKEGFVLNHCKVEGGLGGGHGRLRLVEFGVMSIYL